MTFENAQDFSPDQVVLQYGHYLNQHNIAAIVRLYEENAEIIPDQLSSLKGHQAIVDFYQQTFQGIKIEGELKIIRTDIWQDIAIVRCEEPAMVTELKTGITTKKYLREMFILTRRENHWLIYRYMFSHNAKQAQSNDRITKG